MSCTATISAPRSNAFSIWFPCSSISPFSSFRLTFLCVTWKEPQEGEQNLSNFDVLSQIHKILISGQSRQNNGKRISEGAWKCYPYRRNVISLKILHQFEKHMTQSSMVTDPVVIPTPWTSVWYKSSCYPDTLNFSVVQITELSLIVLTLLQLSRKHTNLSDPLLVNTLPNHTQQIANKFSNTCLKLWSVHGC